MAGIIDDDGAIANIDLMFAIVLVMSAVVMALLLMPNLSHEDRSWRIEQYMTATRASDNLVQDTGSPSNWEMEWNNNYSNVSKIGFLNVDSDDKVLNLTKIQALMGNGYLDDNTNTVSWWEFPNQTTNQSERYNATIALGLEGYNFYIQLHPVGLNNFNLTPLVTNLTNRSLVPINDQTSSAVDRYVYIKDDSSVTGYLSYRDNMVGNNRTVRYRLNLWVW